MKIHEHNAKTNKITVRDATEIEIESILKSEQESLARFEEKARIEAKRAEIFKRLGLTEDEAKVLLG